MWVGSKQERELKHDRGKETRERNKKSQWLVEIPNRNRKRVNQRENGKQREKNIERGEEREEAKKKWKDKLEEKNRENV